MYQLYETKMTASTFTSRDFNREPGRIKRAAAKGMVVITERSKPCVVVLSYKDYQKLRAADASFREKVAMRGLSSIALDTSLPRSVPRAAALD